MNILIAGGTGLIGTHLTNHLLRTGHAVTLLSRQPSNHTVSFPSPVRIVEWNGSTEGAWTSEVEHADAIVNLSGASIGKGRWTNARKKLLLESRIGATKALVGAMRNAARKPNVFISASAVGFYGHVPEEECPESRAPGKDFLAHICDEWEKAALEAEQEGIRVAVPRTGIVLDPKGGALAKLLLPFRMFAGGPLGSGKQWFPWVHLQDEIGAIAHALSTPSLSGPFNIAAPQYVRMGEFARILGKVMHRPAWAPVPGFALKILLGEMAGPLLLSGQKAVSDKLQKSGYVFSYPRLREALEHLLRRS